MTKKIKVLAIPTLLLVTGLASCNTLNSTSGGSGKTVSYEEAYKHVLKNHDPHLNDGLFATYTATINDLQISNLGTYEKNTKTGELDPISEISLGLSNVSVAVDSIPYTFAVGSELFAKYGGYLNAPAAFSVLGVGAQVDYGYTLTNGCLGYYLETNMLTPAINAVGGIMQLLLGKESETVSTYVVTFDANGGDPEPDSQKIEEGKCVVEPSIPPKKDGCTFDGWFLLDGTPYNFATPVTRNFTLYAHWSGVAPATEFTVNFDLNGEAEAIAGTEFMEQTFKEPSTLNGIPKIQPLKEELKQIGWTIDGGKEVYNDGELMNITFSKDSTIRPAWNSSETNSTKSASASKSEEKGDESQGISTYLKLIQNISVGDTTVGLYLNFTEYGFVDSIRVKLNVSDLFAPLDVSVFKEIDGGEAMMALFGPLVGDAFEIGDLTLDVTLSAQYK